MKTKRILTVIFVLCLTAFFTQLSAQDTGHSGRILTAQLSGSNVVPGPGDADGVGTATLTFNPGKGEITYKIEISNVDNITGIHIHKGDASTSGSVVVPLTSKGELSGTVKADKDLIKKIMKNPSGYYVQVHSKDYPAGAIRGQLYMKMDKMKTNKKNDKY